MVEDNPQTFDFTNEFYCSTFYNALSLPEIGTETRAPTIWAFIDFLPCGFEKKSHLKNK